jgi:hypothetical protein
MTRISIKTAAAADSTIPPLSTLPVPYDEAGAAATRPRREIVASPPAVAQRIMLWIDLVCCASAWLAGGGGTTRPARRKI